MMMTRTALAVLVLGMAGACGGTGGASGDVPPCDREPPAAECDITCTFDDECPMGFHCGPGGTCTAECTPGSSECGDGMICDDTGRCLPEGQNLDECQQVRVDVEPQTPTVVLLIDESGSMSGGFGNSNRWDAVVDALVGSDGAVTRLEDRVVFGASLYTSSGGNDGGTCPQLDSVAPAAGNLSAIATLLDEGGPSGDTPTAEAVSATAASFPAADGPRVIVLATDGDPDNCVDADAHDDGSRALSEAAVEQAFAEGISTRVLSVGTDVTATHLGRLADLGIGAAAGSGTGTPYVATDPTELVTAFDEIIRGTRTCSFDLGGAISAEQAAGGTVTLDGMALEYGTDWIQADGDTIELVGDACQTFLAQDSATLEATFPCGVVVL